MEKGMRVNELHVQNIKRIKVVDITPKEDVVVVEGKNRQGKTSTLDSIAYLLGGKELIPTDAVRKGEERASIRAVVGDYEITRTWSNPYESTLKVKAKEGKAIASPQTFLDERLGSASLDVLNFVNLQKEKRVALFTKITGLDLAAKKAERKKLYEARALENRDIAYMTPQVSAMKKENEEMPLLPKPEKTALEYEADEALAHKGNEKIIGDRAAHTRLCDKLGMNTERIKALWAEIARLQDENALTIKAMEPLEESKSKKLNDLAALSEATRAALRYESYELTKTQRAADIEKQEKRLAEARVKSDGYTKAMEAIDEKMNAEMKAVTLPLEGLRFDGETVTYNGIDIEECSQAEKVLIGMAIGLKENPEIRILLVRDGSLLDKESMTTIKDAARSNGYQVWIERVAEEKGDEIYIEDGEAK
jgi:hypothetical protein